MKKSFLFILVVCLLSLKALAQSWVEAGVNTTPLNADGIVISLVSDTTNGDIYAAGAFSNSNPQKQRVAKWDGQNWSSLGDHVPCYATNVINDAIFALALDPTTKTLYAGGYLRDENNQTYIAKWDGTSWSDLNTAGFLALAGPSPGYMSDVRSIKIDHQGNVYAAGGFHDSNQNYFVAKWDGTNWSKVGTLNASDYIYALAIDPVGNVYAGGEFKLSGDNGVALAKWDGSSWSQIGSFNGYIWNITTDATGKVYAAGNFIDANSKRYVAVWDGSAWTELGTGTAALNANNDIRAMAVDHNENVYVGGLFKNSSSKYYVAKWNGITWAEAGTGTDALNANQDILGLTLDGFDNVYIGGDFTNTSGIYYVAEYGNHSVVTSNESASSSKELLAYPNPSSGLLTIDFPERVQVIVHNFLGEEIAVHSFEQGLQSIDLSPFPEGVYHLSFNGESKYKAVRIVKML